MNVLSSIKNIIVLGDGIMIVRMPAVVVIGRVSSAGNDTVGCVLLVRPLRDSLHLKLIHPLSDWSRGAWSSLQSSLHLRRLIRYRWEFRLLLSANQGTSILDLLGLLLFLSFLLELNDFLFSFLLFDVSLKIHDHLLDAILRLLDLSSFANSFEIQALLDILTF